MVLTVAEHHTKMVRGVAFFSVAAINLLISLCAVDTPNSSPYHNNRRSAYLQGMDSSLHTKS